MTALFNLIIYLIETLTGARKERQRRERILAGSKQWVKPPGDVGYGHRQCCNCGAYINDTKLCGYCRTAGGNRVQLNASMAESVTRTRRTLQLYSAPLRVAQPSFVYNYPPGSIVEI